MSAKTKNDPRNFDFDITARALNVLLVLHLKNCGIFNMKHCRFVKKIFRKGQFTSHTKMFGKLSDANLALQSSRVDEERNILEHCQIKMVGGNIKDT